MPPLLTAEDILEMDDVQHTELVAGVLVPLTPAKPLHGIVASRAFWALASHVYTHGAGEVLSAETGFIVRRNPDTVRAPDVAYVTSDRLPLDDIPEGFIDGAPDITIEVISPRNRAREVAKKVVEYLGAGGRLVWVIHPKRRTVTVHDSPASSRVLGAADSLDGGDVLPDFCCAVANLLPPRPR